MMKKLLIVLMFIFQITILIQATELSLDVEAAGTLGDLLNNEINDVTKLNLTGELNGKDIKTIRSMQKLAILDINKANIVSGGGTYFENYETTNNTISTKMFYGLTNLNNVILPASATKIGSDAFVFCSELTDVTIGDNVNTIEYTAFKDCSKLKNVVIGKSLIQIKSYAFSGCTSLTTISLPDGFETIHADAFQGCINLSDVSFPNTLTTISRGAFRGCSGLTGIVIPNSVASIGKNAFIACTGLKNVTIGDGIFILEDGIFENCTGLTKIVIGSGVRILDESPFRNCTGLNEFIVSDNNPYFSTTEGVLFNKEKTTIVQYPNKKTSDYIIPDGVLTIGKYAFYDCTNLTKVTIPESVNKIEAFSFGYGILKENNLKEIICKNPVPPATDSEYVSFGGDITLESSLTVPSGSYSAYKNANGWKDFIHLKEEGTQSTELSLNVETAGSLNSLLGNNIDVVIKLDLTGNLNGSDIKTIRNMENLAFLDISKANIVSGGDAYYENYVTFNNVISNKMFYGLSKLENIVLPNSAEKIGDDIFINCHKLTGVTIGDKITEIGNKAFQGCTELSTITFPISLTTIFDEAFRGCSGLTGIEIPNSVVSIGKNAFMDCTNLKNVTIGDGISILEDGIFENCTGLTKVFFGNKIQIINHLPFKNCTSINEFIVSDNNSYFSTIEGVLFNKEKTTIVQYPNEKTSEYIIPDGVISIEDYAFYDCANLTKVTIPISVNKIGAYSFDYSVSNKNNLKEIICNNPVPPATDLQSTSFGTEITQKCNLTIPSGSLSAYKGANNWKDFINIKEDGSTANIFLENDNFFIYTISSGIQFKTSEITPVVIFNISGQKIIDTKVENNSIIKLNRGIYIIKTKEDSFKVIIN